MTKVRWVVANLLTEINEDNLSHYFGNLQADAQDLKGASHRYATWIDLRYKLWRLSDEHFSEAMSAIRSLLERYDQVGAQRASKQQQQAERTPSIEQQQELMNRRGNEQEGAPIVSKIPAV